jgi:hypothetical protein
LILIISKKIATVEEVKFATNEKVSFMFYSKNLTYNVSMRAATVNLNGSWFKEGTHLTNIVQLNGEVFS